ncbi:MAG: DNA topoisomerase [Pseudomonadota bacterium]
MPQPLVIVESQDKGSIIKDQWIGGCDTIVIDSVPMRVAPDTNKKDALAFSFVPLPSAQALCDKLASGINSEIYLAFDPTEQGEYWSWMISEFIRTKTNGKISVKRIILNQITQEEIARCADDPNDIQSDIAIALQVRSIFDYFLGKQIERMLGTRTGVMGLPLDLATLAVMFFLADKENEIKTFSPANKWEISAESITPDGKIVARLIKADNITDDGFIKSKEDVQSLLGRLKENPLTITSIKKTPCSFSSPKPFNTTDLLLEAYLLLGIKPGDTLKLLKQLFYGAKLNGLRHGLISFYSTLETGLPDDALESIRNIVAKLRGETLLGEEHEADDCDELPILPVNAELSLAPGGTITIQKEAADLYQLVRSRALASQMKPATGETIEAQFKVSDRYLFSAESNIVTAKGYMEEYQGFVEKKLLSPSPLAKLNEGTQLRIAKIIPRQTSSQPAEYYTMETLLNDLGEMGLDLNDSMISIFHNMIEKGYMEISEDGGLRPLENTEKVVQVFERALPSMAGVNFIAYIVQTIEEATSGRKSLAWAVEQFNQTLNMHGKTLFKPKPKAPEPAPTPAAPEIKPQAAQAPIPEIKPQAAAPAPEPEKAALPAEIPAKEIKPEEPPQAEKAAPKEPPVAEPLPIKKTEPKEEPAPNPPQETFAEQEAPICPECGSALMLKAGRFGQFYGCSNYPVCRFTKAIKKGEPEEKKNCPKCSKQMTIKRGRFGVFWACTGYPECRHTEPFGQQETFDMKCPICGKGKLQVKRTRIGKNFYVCTEEGCDFVAWSKPHNIPCPACRNQFLVEKESTSGDVSLKCPRPGCKHQQPLTDSEGKQQAAKPAVKRPLKRRLVRSRTAARSRVAKTTTAKRSTAQSAKKTKVVRTVTKKRTR